MNKSLSDIEVYSENDLCRQISLCYRLSPPPRPPNFPELLLTNSSSTLVNRRQQTDIYFIISGIFITLISTCIILLLLSIKFQFYHKLRQYFRLTKPTTDQSPSFSNIVPISYNSLTPLTTTSNLSPSLYIQQHLHTHHRSSDHNHSYEEIRFDHNCSHNLPYYQEKHPITPYYHTYELSPSKLVCQNCVLDTLHRKQQCICQNFFIPIK